MRGGRTIGEEEQQQRETELWLLTLTAILSSIENCDSIISGPCVCQCVCVYAS